MRGMVKKNKSPNAALAFDICALRNIYIHQVMQSVPSSYMVLFFSLLLFVRFLLCDVIKC
ncbi:uncharacterized protein BDW43DRAFT_292498 [Aspergillus alliaceus]|uniref:uncharacterized protein n=1 Tax=Petromyces alliaceus TaxID=209559 RepID=UPI0012A47F46|nr:uncharacterized protein BDW43DRAFT_292498 [Aspergillus alliaceus]KAB8228078.1 hypothetical protein BDW43DRAFT_292498 [Aspergillus alliaceus]